MKPGESAQMTPVGTGVVAAIEVRQVPTHGGSEGRAPWSGADMHPRLPMARAHHARFMSVGPHRPQHHGTDVIQVDQDVAGVAALSIGVDVHVGSFAVTHPQIADGCEVCQLSGSPQPFSGKRPFGQIVDQTNKVKFAGHCASWRRMACKVR